MNTLKLPPLNALRAFETTARHQSVTKAAAELHVTPAAVSHQIKSLESQLQVALFRRRHRRLELTDAGRACLPGLSDGFVRLANAVTLVRRHQTHRRLTVSVAPSFGSKWLVPRLDRFYTSNPTINVRIDASTRLADFHADDVEIGIRYGGGDYSGLHIDRLLDEKVFPVCSPSLLEFGPALNTPDDLRHHTLLHEDGLAQHSSWPDWNTWLRSAGLADIDTNHGATFTLASMAVQAAIEGHGVCLADRALVADDLAAGRLVQPFKLSFPTEFAYYLVCLPERLNEVAVAQFRRWILAETGAAIGPAAI
ncbi:MAG: transcriptional regulator GcvA [Gammaproteobacteria bacterium]|nr:transcriptional regulator GcvA [Gammaproteobacteria bacterium]MDH3468137.1 transcriptional regulator GcvA [Gammaproteobacteria bacterium]